MQTLNATDRTIAAAIDWEKFFTKVSALPASTPRSARAMRPSPGKRCGCIVVPIVVPSGMAFAEFAEIRGDVPMAMKVDLDKFREQVRLRLWERIGRVNWRPFGDAREFARGPGLKNAMEWATFSRTDALPPDIPAAPQIVFRNEAWAGCRDWPGTETK